MTANDETMSVTATNCSICHQSHVGLFPREVGNLHEAAVNSWTPDCRDTGVYNNVEHSRWAGGRSFPNDAAIEAYKAAHPPKAYDLACATLGNFLKTYTYGRYADAPYLEKYENGALVHNVGTGWVYYFPASKMTEAFEFARALGARDRSLNRMFGQ